MTHEITENQSFNTQPPKGGWENILRFIDNNYSFNTQPPKGGWFQQPSRKLGLC